MIVPDHIEKNARLYRDKTAIVFEERRCTFDELQDRVYRLCNGLIGLGVKKGDRIAAIQDNCFEYPELYYGIGKIGAMITPLNYRLLGSELAYLLDHSEANTLIIGKDFMENFSPFLSRLKYVRHVICIGDGPEGTINYDDLLTGSANKNPGVDIGPDDRSALVYTGGTTGRPKGVIQTHKNWMTTATTHVVEWGNYGEID